MVDSYNNEYEGDMKLFGYRLVKPRAYAVGRKLTLQPRVHQPSAGHLTEDRMFYKTPPVVSYPLETRQRIETLTKRISSRLETISGHFLNSNDLIFLGFDENRNMVFMPTVDL